MVTLNGKVMVVIGAIALNEIKEILVEMGLSLSMELEGFDAANNPYEKNKKL